MQEIHISDIKSFKGCRLKWSLSSPLKANLEPKTPPRQLFIGTGVHYAMDAYVNAGPKAVLTSFEEWLRDSAARIPDSSKVGKYWEELVGDIELAGDVLKHYLLWSVTNDTNFKFITGEMSHRMKLPGVDAEYVMRADGLLEKDGKLWVIEWKTCASFPSIDELWRDEQNAAYVVALQYNRPTWFTEKQNVVGTVYTFLRKKRPQRPKTLQDGTLSHAAIDTSTEAFLVELKTAGISPRMYGDVISKLQSEDNKFFRRAWIERTPESLAYAFENIVVTAKEMLDPNVAIYPSPDWWKCARCSFSTACVLIHNRADPWPLLNSEFRKREPVKVSILSEEEGGE